MSKFAARHIGSLALVVAAGMALSGQPGRAATDTTNPPTPESSTKRFGDWTVQCRMMPSDPVVPTDPVAEAAGTDGAAGANGTAEGDADASPQQHCEMVQTLTQTETGKRVMSLSLQKKDDAVTLILLAPFGLDVGQPVQLRNADKSVLKANFRTCLPAGCLTKTVLTKAMQDGLADAETVTVVLPRLDGAEPFELIVQNTGFTEALTDLISESTAATK